MKNEDKSDSSETRNPIERHMYRLEEYARNLQAIAKIMVEMKYTREPGQLQRNIQSLEKLARSMVDMQKIAQIKKSKRELRRAEDYVNAIRCLATW